MKVTKKTVIYVELTESEFKCAKDIVKNGNAIQALSFLNDVMKSSNV